jgi:hypothetical protein
MKEQMNEYNWTQGSMDWHYLDNGKGEVIASISAYGFPICCFIGGAKAGEYTTLELAKEKLIEKCRQKRLL